MLVSKFLNKVVPAVEGEVFKIVGSVPTILVSLHNQHEQNTMVYRFQHSDDGISWTNIELATSGGGVSSTFSIPFGETHSVKLTTNKPRLRMLAYGDVPVGIGLNYNVSTPTDTASAELFPN